MNLRSIVISSALLVTSLGPVLQAEDISFFSGSLTAADATELGRPSRSSMPQTWAGTEAYGGVLATTTSFTYYYRTYTFDKSLFAGAPFVDIRLGMRHLTCLQRLMRAAIT